MNHSKIDTDNVRGAPENQMEGSTQELDVCFRYSVRSEVHEDDESKHEEYMRWKGT